MSVGGGGARPSRLHPLHTRDAGPPRIDIPTQEGAGGIDLFVSVRKTHIGIDPEHEASTSAVPIEPLVPGLHTRFCNAQLQSGAGRIAGFVAPGSRCEARDATACQFRKGALRLLERSHGGPILL